jgi:hypothetical protein
MHAIKVPPGELVGYVRRAQGLHLPVSSCERDQMDTGTFIKVEIRCE